MKTVFLSVPTYVYSSDFLHTRFIAALAERCRVVILLPMAAAGYPQHPHVTYRSWNVQFPRYWNFWGRSIRVPLIRSFDHEPLIQRNYLLSFGHWKRKLLRRSAFLFPKGFWNPDSIMRFERLFLPRAPEFERLVAEHQPALVVTPTPGFNDMDAELILLAKRARIPTVAIDFSWDNLTSTGKHLRRTDYLICWTPVLKRYAETIHRFSPRQIFVSGIMRFDHYFREDNANLRIDANAANRSREAFLVSKGLNPAEKTILITTVTKGNYKDEPTVARDLIAARDAGRLPGSPNIFIRVHPKVDNIEEYTDLSRFPRVHVERSGKEVPEIGGMRIELDGDDLVNLKDTLRHADVNVNYLSTLSIESCIFDKPVVNIGFPPYYRQWYAASHYKPLVDAGAVKIAESFDEFVMLLARYLREPGQEAENRRQIVESHVGFTDGKSYERCAALLADIAAKAEQP